MANSEYPYSFLFDVTRLGNSAHDVTLELGPEDLVKMAKLYDLVELESLRAQLHIRPWRKNGAAVEGSFKAKARQKCVVTLETMQTKIADEFERTYAPAQGRRPKRNEEETLEIDLDMDAKDPPDVFEGSTIDLGALICEQFALVLDPFPRSQKAKVDEIYQQQDEEEVEEKPSPFAALAALKKGENR
ncbi:YceD family protein [Flexibacterium corallicola]|uniref:YceD family protein n=1 Tax=Flexibacterium corallicola TaxID=3037259 RepID=UPI00286FA516|nr:DUF177 domain-containing protein [Pseudovibrio sp. M1P-2-3]